VSVFPPAVGALWAADLRFTKFSKSYSDNLTPQETTEANSGTVGAEGAGLSCPGSSVVANSKGAVARFENRTASENIGPDLSSSFSSQSLPETSEAGEEPVKHDRTR
jgi:hypothetical protein